MYYVYILTNKRKTVLYTGMTNDLNRRMVEHASNGDRKSFTARYNCHHLVLYEAYQTAMEAIRREKYIKGKSRKWKETLIEAFNSQWQFLEHDIPM
jgi:putative endonuclease